MAEKERKIKFKDDETKKLKEETLTISDDAFAIVQAIHDLRRAIERP